MILEIIFKTPVSGAMSHTERRQENTAQSKSVANIVEKQTSNNLIRICIPIFGLVLLFFQWKLFLNEFSMKFH